MDKKQLELEILRLYKEIDNHSLKVTEGSASINELMSLLTIREKSGSLEICEIGFNAGLSSLAFLLSDGNSTVTSFDIGNHPYVQPAKKYIDSRFPQRHNLVLGDSTEAVPLFSNSNPEQKFDLIFIDGGHSYSVAMQDIKNCMSLAHNDTVVIVDDLVPWLPWGFGPWKAWRKAKKINLINETFRESDGFIYPRRTWAAGKYLQ